MKIFYIVLVLLIPVFGSAQKIYVDINNTSGIEDGTSTHPFNTVEEGLASCNNLDTIFIAAGDYFPDSLKIHNNITIIGEGKEATTVNGTFILSYLLDTLPVSVYNLKCTDIWQSDTTITSTPLIVRNCGLQTFTNNLGVADSTAFLKFFDNEIADSIYINNAKLCALREIYNCKSGSSLIAEITMLSNQFKIKKCEVGGSLSVLTTLCQDSVFVENNIVTDSMAVHAVRASQFVINGNSCGTGLSVTTVVSDGNHIIGNTIGKDLSVYALQIPGNQIIGNTIGTGIRVKATAISGNEIKNNIIIEGVLKCNFVSAANVYIDNNQFRNGGIDYKATASDARITNNAIFSDGHVPGIRYKITSGGYITGNKIVLPYIEPSEELHTKEVRDNEEEDYVTQMADTCSVEIWATAFSEIRDNYIQGGAYGIFMNATASKIKNNTVTGSGNGIFICSTYCPTDSNRVNNCAYDGITLNAKYDEDEGEFYPNDTTVIPMRYNIITNNGRNGIRLRKRAVLSYNNLTNNGNYDLYLETPVSLNSKIYAVDNLWDHEDLAEIDLYDIYDDDENESVASAFFDLFLLHPGVPKLLLPLNEAFFPDSSHLTFSWEKDENADSYEFMLSSDSLFSDTISTEIISDTTFVYSALDAGKDYYWQVRSLRLGYLSEWSETRNFSTSIPDGIDETLPSSEVLKVYPNPVSDKLYIQMPKGTTPFNLRIIDIYGRIVRSQKSFSDKNIDVSGLPAGVYCISLQNKKKIYNARFVKN